MAECNGPGTTGQQNTMPQYPGYERAVEFKHAVDYLKAAVSEKDDWQEEKPDEAVW
jgi:hypothetical protein